MVIRLKLFVQNADSVPKLGLFDVFQRIKSVLIGIESLMNLVSEQITVAQGSPGGAIVRIQGGHLAVVLNGRVIICLESAKLGQLAQTVETNQVFTLLDVLLRVNGRQSVVLNLLNNWSEGVSLRKLMLHLIDLVLLALILLLHKKIEIQLVAWLLR